MSQIPEIDIKVTSIHPNVTHKLRAKWSPELAQDLKALDYMDFGYSSNKKFNMSDYLYTSHKSPLDGESLFTDYIGSI